MPPTADLLDRDHSATAGAALPARRRRRRTEPNTSPAFGRGVPHAAAALQRALDRRDNGGVTGH
ncbi:hypothetical protein C7C46_16145 [Streptomyces tateyamensis]|uniref:Uncharacterized protein n=1 Tax=Streptomyces tateyamensis TaxID=565073 RepID=A0A2V4N5X5_9ACTN|nr:hypothetical protein [Streptomyces tateyamensis]PYC78369.1 hypothetical protein C7C46_16145 [Streptomyces tateyamensis]